MHGAAAGPDAEEHPCYLINSALRAFAAQVGACMKGMRYQLQCETERFYTKV